MSEFGNTLTKTAQFYKDSLQVSHKDRHVGLEFLIVNQLMNVMKLCHYNQVKIKFWVLAHSLIGHYDKSVQEIISDILPRWIANLRGVPVVSYLLFYYYYNKQIGCVIKYNKLCLNTLIYPLLSLKIGKLSIITEMCDYIHYNTIQYNKAKCEFNKNKLEFYGHSFSAGGISANPRKISVIGNTLGGSKIQFVKKNPTIEFKNKDTYCYFVL